ncbi:MAG: hypothetical protein H0T78_05325, partial [Longispora sp.]|nr:hypothetical protein [Longispora sp. (in: high G+C Gram-positive bacteria)]
GVEVDTGAFDLGTTTDLAEVVEPRVRPFNNPSIPILDRRGYALAGDRRQQRMFIDDLAGRLVVVSDV